jgi:Skp family chaperone for outer membrane proteins
MKNWLRGGGVLLLLGSLALAGRSRSDTLAPLQARNARLKKAGSALTRQLSSPDVTDRRKAELQKKLRLVTRQLEDLKAEATAVITRKQEAQLKALYQDVEAAARRYARAHGIELVLHYNDAVKEPDLSKAPNSQRKLQAGSCIPLCSAPGIDVSEAVLAALNHDYRR